MQIAPADLPLLTTLIADLQAAQIAHDTRSAENARLSKALADAKPGSDEHAAARKAWDEARASRTTTGPSVLEARDKLADFAQRMTLQPEAEVERKPAVGVEGDGEGISRAPL